MSTAITNSAAPPADVLAFPDPDETYALLKRRFGDITPMTFVTMPTHLAINPTRVGAGVAVARHPGVLFPIATAQFSDSGMATRWCCRMNQKVPFNILQQSEVEVAARYTNGMRQIAAQISNLIKFSPGYVDQVVVVPIPCSPGYSFGLMNPDHPSLIQPVFAPQLQREPLKMQAMLICEEINQALGVSRNSGLHAAGLIEDYRHISYTAPLSERWDVLVD